MSQFGYTEKILRVNLSSGRIDEVSTQEYAERFLGGRGIGAKVYWDEVAPEVGALEAENRLVIAPGPLAGLPVIGGSRWTICGKSPEPYPESFSYGNMGGRFGAELKFAGYDAIVIHGESDKPVYLHIHDGIAELKDASFLWGNGAIDTREMLKKQHGNSARVVAMGPAGENMVVMAILLADNDASGSGGLGAVLGSKKLKAIVVKGTGQKVNVAQPERLKELTQYYRDLGRGFLEYLSRWSRDMHRNFRLVPGPEMKKEPCYGCLGRCPRKVYRAQDGKEGKFWCHSAVFYQPWAERYYGDWNDVPFHATKLCDTFGLDAVAMDLIISWLYECHKVGVLTDENTGIPISKIGTMEFIETLVRKISFREGFGDILAQGLERAADTIGPDAKAMLEVAGYFSEPNSGMYAPRLYTMNALPYAMEPRVPIQHLHETGFVISYWVGSAIHGIGDITSEVLQAIAQRFWGSEIAVDFSTYEGKALAAKMIQDREYAKECLVLCDLLWPMVDLPNSEDHVGDPTLESKILSAVTGNEVDEQGLYRIGERVFNLQRAILVREGRHGRDFDRLPDSWHTVPLEYDFTNCDCLVPGKNGEQISRKGEVVDRVQFERMKDEYYQLRQWDVATGLQTKEHLEALQLKEVAHDLEQRGLVVSAPRV